MASQFIGYPPEDTNVIKSFDAVNFETGLGYQTYYLGQSLGTTISGENTINCTVSGLLLFDQTFFPLKRETSAQSTSTTDDITIDLHGWTPAFSRAFNMKGTAYVEMSWVNGSLISGHLSAVELYRVTNSNAEILISESFSGFQLGVGTVSGQGLIPLKLNKQEKIAPGERIKVHIQGRIDQDGSAGTKLITIPYDPKGRATPSYSSTDGSSSILVHLPFKI